MVVSTNNAARRVKLPAIAERGWTALSEKSPVEPTAFDPATLADLPPPTQRLLGSGTAGWGFGTEHEADGIFFRYRITGAAFSPT